MKSAWVLCAVAMLSVACSRQTGARGELIFMYESPEAFENFNKPIALGAELEVFVHDVREDVPTQVLSVRTSNPKVLRVSGKAGPMFGLKAMRKGTSRVIVKARDASGEVRVDGFLMRVDDVARVELFDPCAPEGDGPHGVYLTGTKQVSVPWSRRSTKNEVLTGFGPVPVRVEPKGAARIRPIGNDQSGVLLDMPETPGTFHLASDSGRVRFDVVDIASIDRVAGSGGAQFTVVGGWAFGAAMPMVGNRPLCAHELKHEVRSLTPSICAVKPAPWSGEAMILGKGFGICTYEVSFPEANVSKKFTLPVGKLPGASEVMAAKNGEVPWWLAPLLAMLAPLLCAPLWLRRRREDVGGSRR